MTELSGSQALADRRLYSQDTQPVDERDGVLWLDTSDPARPLYQYSSDSSSWERVVRVFNQDTEPSSPRDGDIWIDGTNTMKVYDSGDARFEKVANPSLPLAMGMINLI